MKGIEFFSLGGLFGKASYLQNLNLMFLMLVLEQSDTYGCRQGPRGESALPSPPLPLGRKVVMGYCR